MRAVLGREAFASWLAGFLPRLSGGEPVTLFAPGFVSDRSDGKIAHLDGLNLSRAWCWRLILEGVNDSDARKQIEVAIAIHQKLHRFASVVGGSNPNCSANAGR